MSLFPSTSTTQTSATTPVVERSPAYCRLEQDLSFGRFLELTKSPLGEIPYLQPEGKPAEYHRRRFERLDEAEVEALMDELIVGCLDSPVRLAEISYSENGSIFVQIGSHYLRELTTIFGSLQISPSMAKEVKQRLFTAISNPQEEDRHLLDIALLDSSLPKGFVKATEVAPLLDQRIGWELQNKFERVDELMDLPFFRDRIEFWRRSPERQAHVTSCILTYLQGPLPLWAEISNGADQGSGSSATTEDSYAQQKVAGVVSLFRAHEIVSNPQYLELVGKVLDDEIATGFIYGLNGWIGALGRRPDVIRSVAPEVSALIEGKREKVLRIVSNCLMQDDFDVADVIAVRETCRYFFRAQDYDSPDFVESLHMAVRTLVEKEAPISKVASLLQLVSDKNRNEILDDPDLLVDIPELFEVYKKWFNDCISILTNRDSYESGDNEKLQRVDEIINVYRWSGRLARAAVILEIDNSEIGRCPGWVKLLGRAHSPILSVLDESNTDGLAPEKTSLLSAAWVDGIEHAQKLYADNQYDSAWLMARKLLSEAKRIDHIANYVDQIGETLELLALASPNGKEKEHRFRAALVFRMREQGLTSIKTKQTLAEFAGYLKANRQPSNHIQLLADMITRYNNQNDDETEKAMEGQIKSFFQDEDSLASELGFPPYWFKKIVKEASH